MPALASFIVLAALGAGPLGSDYPDQARREYVDVCATVNGRTPEASRSCTCSIDVIASILPFADYERAETILRMRQMGGGYLAQEFHVPASNDVLRSLHEAQAEAEVRCF